MVLAGSEKKASWSYDESFFSVFMFSLNFLPASGIFCCLLMHYANNLATDQARHNVGPDRSPN